MTSQQKIKFAEILTELIKLWNIIIKLTMNKVKELVENRVTIIEQEINKVGKRKMDSEILSEYNQLKFFLDNIDIFTQTLDIMSDSFNKGRQEGWDEASSHIYNTM